MNEAGKGNDLVTRDCCASAADLGSGVLKPWSEVYRFPGPEREKPSSGAVGSAPMFSEETRAAEGRAHVSAAACDYKMLCFSDIDGTLVHYEDMER